MNSSSTSLIWRDTPQRYGRISRLLHWSMALLFAWQFAGMVLKLTLGWHPRDSWMLGTHADVGVLLWGLLLVRALWALANLRNRPSYGRGFMARAAGLGHLLLYLLMFAVPSLALLRQYGSGRGYSLFGALQVFAPGEPNQALVQSVNATREALGVSVHGLLGWLLLLVIVGHIGMVLLHHSVWKDGTVGKMIGPT